MNPRIRLAHRIAVDGVRLPKLYDTAGPFDRRLCELSAKAITDCVRGGKCVSIVCDNVLEMYLASPYERWKPESFPESLPPFQECLCEWKQAGSETIPGYSPGVTGVVVAHFDLRAEGKRRQWAESFYPGSPKEARPFIGFVGAMDMVSHVALFTSVALWPSGDVVVVPTMLMVALSATGKTLSHYAYTHNSLNVDEGLTLCHIPRLAFSLMSCRNVVQEPLPVSDLPEEKWTRRQGDKVKGLVFKTLRIDGIGGKSRRETGEPSGEHNRFHICRGSFAEYTAEKPLFGKYTGRFWRPAHVKGSKEVGEVVKDYDVGPRVGVQNADS